MLDGKFFPQFFFMENVLHTVNLLCNRLFVRHKFIMVIVIKNYDLLLLNNI